MRHNVFYNFSMLDTIRKEDTLKTASLYLFEVKALMCLKIVLPIAVFYSLFLFSFFPPSSWLPPTIQK